MKRFHINLLAVFALAMTWACTEEDTRTVMTDNPDSAVLSSPAPGSTVVLTQDTGSEMVTFSYAPADYGFPAAVNYTVQMAEAGTSFESPVDIGSSNGSSVQISQAELNQKLIQKGFAPDAEVEVDIRIRSSVGPTVAPVYSASVPLVMTPYAVELTFARMYVPGDYQGWNPGNENTIIYSVENNDVYEGFVHILGGSGAFKVNEEPNWDVNYGGGNGVLEQNGSDLQIPEPFGTFRLTVDLNAGTYVIGTRRRWGIIGDATPLGWGADTPLEFNADENVLTLTLDLLAGEMKFRAGDWAFNYGDTGLDGLLNDDGANIPVTEAGNYTIIMDWKVPGEISYELIKN